MPTTVKCYTGDSEKAELPCDDDQVGTWCALEVYLQDGGDWKKFRKDPCGKNRTEGCLRNFKSKKPRYNCACNSEGAKNGVCNTDAWMTESVNDAIRQYNATLTTTTTLSTTTASTVTGEVVAEESGFIVWAIAGGAAFLCLVLVAGAIIVGVVLMRRRAKRAQKKEKENRPLANIDFATMTDTDEATFNETSGTLPNASEKQIERRLKALVKAVTRFRFTDVDRRMKKEFAKYEHNAGDVYPPVAADAKPDEYGSVETGNKWRLAQSYSTPIVKQTALPRYGALPRLNANVVRGSGGIIVGQIVTECQLPIFWETALEIGIGSIVHICEQDIGLNLPLACSAQELQKLIDVFVGKKNRASAGSEFTNEDSEKNEKTITLDGWNKYKKEKRTLPAKQQTLLSVMLSYDKKHIITVRVEEEPFVYDVEERTLRVELRSLDGKTVEKTAVIAHTNVTMWPRDMELALLTFNDILPVVKCELERFEKFVPKKNLDRHQVFIQDDTGCGRSCQLAAIINLPRQLLHAPRKNERDAILFKEILSHVAAVKTSRCGSFQSAMDGHYVFLVLAEYVMSFVKKPGDRRIIKAFTQKSCGAMDALFDKSDEDRYDNTKKLAVFPETLPKQPSIVPNPPLANSSLRPTPSSVPNPPVTNPSLRPPS